MDKKVCPKCGQEKDPRGFDKHVSICVVEPEKTKAVEATPKQENKLFHNLEEDRIRLEESQRKKAEKEKAREEEIKHAERESRKHDPFLQCPFCQNIQYEVFSRDPTTAWCLKCGKAFMVDWK